jgi:hypothetical protein
LNTLTVKVLRLEIKGRTIYNKRVLLQYSFFKMAHISKQPA